MINLGVFSHLMSVVKVSWMQVIERTGWQYWHKSGAEDEVQYSSSSSPSHSAGHILPAANGLVSVLLRTNWQIRGLCQRSGPLSSVCCLFPCVIQVVKIICPLEVAAIDVQCVWVWEVLFNCLPYYPPAVCVYVPLKLLIDCSCEHLCSGCGSSNGPDHEYASFSGQRTLNPLGFQNPNVNLSNVTWNVSERSGLTAELTEENNQYDRQRGRERRGRREAKI